MPIHLTPAEMHFMEKFFDSVAGAISARLVSGSNVGEEALTFLLCEMMDENWNSSHVLSYDLAALTRDLLHCGDLHKVEVAFETHEHGKGFEGRHTYADLGLIIRYDDHFLLQGRLGETNQELIQLASGRLPENIQPDLPVRAVKHTMTVTVRSTLRQQ